MTQTLRIALYTAFILIASCLFLNSSYAQFEMTPQQQSEMLQKLSPEQQDAAKSLIENRTNSRKSRRSEKILNKSMV